MTRRPNVTQYAAILNVSASASETDIKRAFREKAKTLHPDTAGEGHEDGRDFGELREAYEYLLEHVSSKDVGVDNVYGPGMYARFEAAKRWRERQASHDAPNKAARNVKLKDRNFKTSRSCDNDWKSNPEHFQPCLGQNSYMHGSDDEATLQAILLRQKARISTLGGGRFLLPNSFSRVSQITVKVFGVSTIIFGVLISGPSGQHFGWW